LTKIMAKLQSHEKKEPRREKTRPLISVGRLEVRNAVFITEISQQHYRIPFEIDVFPEAKNIKVLNLVAHLYLRGQKVSTTARIDLNQQKSSFKFDALGLDFERFSDLVGQIPDLKISGKLDIKGSASLQLKPFHISTVAVECKLNDSQIGHKSFLLQNSLNQEGEKLPLTLKIHGTHGKPWEIAGSSFSASSPLPLKVTEFSSNLKLTENALETSGRIMAILAPPSGGQSETFPVKFLVPTAIQGKFTAKVDRDGNWQFNFTNQTTKKPFRKSAGILINGFTFISKVPTIHISGKGDKEQSSTKVEVVASNTQIESASATAKVPALNLKVTASYAQSQKKYQTADFKISFPAVRLTLDSAQAELHEGFFSGNVKQDRKGKFLLNSMLSFAGGKFLFPRSGIKVIDFCADFPLQWPPGPTEKSGKFSIGAVQYRHLNLGEVSGKLHQTATGIAFEGEHTSKLVPQLALKFDGNSDLFQSRDYGLDLHFNVAGQNHAAEIDLGKLTPAAGGVTINGNFEAQGELCLSKAGLNSRVHMTLVNGKLFLPENRFVVEGIRMSLLVPNLPEIRSEPKQILTFTRASMGGLNIENGHIEYQLEPPKSVFIEKSHFEWCDGKVDIPAIRVIPGEDVYNLTLYCDRLNLAKVVEQFGVASAEGKGTVSGKIPLRYKNGKLSFDDGFLFSTPGEGGKIHLKGTEMLTAGIPSNTPQYTQMELAREALKDYDYSWAKLNLTTEGEDFLLRLQFDGKPAGLLPFVYKKEIGGFARVEVGSEGSRFQGIRLDVNFRLPLNKVLRYKDIFNMMQ